MARQSQRDKDYLKRCKQRVLASAKRREQERYDDLWRRMIDLYRNKHFEGISQADRIAINIAFSTINTVFPAISVSYPKLDVSARRPELADAAAVVEAVVNYQWEHYECHPEFRRASLDYLIIGHGWTKQGWKYAEKTIDRHPDEIQNEYQQMLDQHTQAIAANVDPNMLPTEQDVYDGIPKTTTMPTVDRPFMERVSPFDIIVDMDATSMQDLRWIAQRIYLPWEEFKNDTRWKASARNALSPPTFDSPMASVNKENRRKDKDAQYVTIYEYYDIVHDTMCVFSETGDDFLYDPIETPLPFGHPFTMLRNYDVPDEFYPMGDLECLEQLQQELNSTRSDQLQHRKNLTQKVMVKADLLSDEVTKALTSKDPNVIVPIDTDQPLSQVISVLQAPQMPPEFYQMSDVIENDIDRVSGINEYQRGSLPDIRRTATEASIITDAANARSSEKLETIEGAISHCAARLIQLSQQFLTTDQVVRIVGPEGGQNWITYDHDAIQGEFDFKVQAGSTQPNNESLRRQSAMQLMDAMSAFLTPDPMTGQTVVDPRELAKHVLKEGFGIKNAETFITAPAPPPMIDPTTGQPMPPMDPNAPPGGDPNAPPGAAPAGPPPGGPPGAPPGGGPPTDQLAALLGGGQPPQGPGGF